MTPSPKYPCHNCITFAICKAQITPHLNQDNKSLLIDFINIIDRKCPKITEYVQTNRPETVQLVPFICDTVKDIFQNENNTPMQEVYSKTYMQSILP